MKYKGPKPKGRKDPKFGECILVPLDQAPEHSQFPKVYTKLSIPNTFYRYDPADGVVRTMITVMPNDLHVAWFTCGQCSSDFKYCTCKQGLTTPRSIEVIYDQIVAEQAGEEWGVHHPNYAGSRRKALRQGASKPHWNEGGAVITPKTRKAATGASTAPKRSLSRHKPGKVAAEPVEVDMNKIDKAAAASADETTAQLTRKLSGRKPTRKTTTKKTSGLTRKKKA